MDPRKRSSASRSDTHHHGGHYENGADYRDPPGYVDDIKDDELMADILKEEPGKSAGMESVIIIDGLPVVPAEQKDRQEKLKNVVRKLIIQHTKCTQSDFLEEVYPVEEDGSTKGFAFFEFTEPEFAKLAIQGMNGYKFDKQHTLAVDLFIDFDKYASYPDEWEEPAVRPFKEHGNLRYWLESEDCYDQYLLIYGSHSGCEEAAVYANTPVEPTQLEHRDHWTDYQAIWSPLGTYLATFHQKGLALWGGKEHKQITRFAHQHVSDAMFSPKERYILTIRPKPDFLPVDDQSMILWDVVTSAKKKAFSWDSKERPSASSVKWSPDENFFGLMSKDAINIYETETFGLQNKKSHSIPGLADFTWSPTQNYLAYWVKEITDIPARLGLMDVTSRTDVRSKQLFSVTDCQFYWQKNGEYMAVKVNRYKHIKRGKGPNAPVEYAGLYYNLEIFVLTTKKEVPVESVEIRDPIIDIAWEPNGNKLVVLTVAESVTSVSFYSGRLDHKFELIKKIPLRHKVDRISWSPMGQFVVLHTSASSSVGYLVFIDTADLSILADVEHFVLSEVQWDPTGRYLTAITMGNNKKDNGYTLYSFQGRYVRNEKVEGLSMFTWRPRPPTLLSLEKQKEIKKNLKKYTPEFEARDKMLLNKASKEVAERRKRQMDEFMDFLTVKQHAFQSARHKRIALRGGIDTEEIDAHPEELVEEKLEIILSVTSTPLE
ncbi:Eukaryotic translation initiation factor 3 subunit B [Hypsibius exemplaris]|uniref:Eukaryotic translation initiation factor 3 subunit B n=1 Tax=Hypsibius exemplaris TaxID=2072580 RepID=A0A1W0X395_HYPEX|nr:Eukaryotic translation initiation factor 3 subunit B [Hypsibius exemplaris]